MLPNQVGEARSAPAEDGGAAGRRGRDGAPGLTDDLIQRFGYLGIILLLVLGGLGLPVPEEAPIIIFALARTAGWLAHAMEQIESGHLIRPRARYVGPSPAGPER